MRELKASKKTRERYENLSEKEKKTKSKNMAMNIWNVF